MSRHRFFVASALPGLGEVAPVPLTDADAHHAVGVLRIRPGEEIVLVSPAGQAQVVEIVSVGPGEGLFGKFLHDLPAQSEPHITLAQGIMKGPVMDEVVQHAVELGAERIVPLVTKRTIVRLDRERSAARVVRWQKIAEGAAKQSQRARVPQVASPADIAGAASLIGENDLVVVLWEEAEATSLTNALARVGVTPSRPDARVALVVGPEGGLAAEEVAVLAEGGAVVASLGPAVLRAETASLVAMTLTALALGALEPSDAS